jgi:Aldehyde dehydrogenase family
VLKEPVGVVGAISAWNFPFEIASNKLGQALATGNTIVIKPAIETPWNALRLGRIIAEKTDIPSGVVNIVPTSSNELAQTLVTDARIDMVSFTGSTAVGKHIQSLSAATMKRTLLELGGKSAYTSCSRMPTSKPLCPGASVPSPTRGRGAVSRRVYSCRPASTIRRSRRLRRCVPLCPLVIPPIPLLCADRSYENVNGSAYSITSGSAAPTEAD